MNISRPTYVQRITNSLCPEKITFLIGARRVGKTTLIKEIQKKYKEEETLYYSFDDIVSLPKFSGTDDFLAYIIAKTGNSLEKIKYLFLDEVQHIANIEVFFKDIVDNKSQFSIVASGSGSFEIFHVIKESLMGRKTTIYVYPFSFQEFLSAKNENIFEWKNKWSLHLYQEKKHLIEEFLRFGGYPSVVLKNTEEEKFSELQEILDSWIQQDIQLLLKKEEITNFSLFLKRISFNTGGLIKIDKIFQELHIPKRTLEKFFLILEKSFLTLFISPFSGKRKDEIISHKKIFFWDNGILNMLKKNFQLSPETKGMLVENFVCTEILKNKKDYEDCFFWRTRNGTEIDFIIKNALTGSINGYEIKSSSSQSIPKSFYSFSEIYTPQSLTLCNTDIKQKKETDFSTQFFITPFIFSFISEK